MSKKANKIITEQLLRSETKKQMENLYKNIKKSGGDIGEKVRKTEKTKEDNLPNTQYMDNPFGSKRKLDTWENFSKNDAHIKSKTNENIKSFDEFIINEEKDLKGMYTWKDEYGINLTDDSWVKGTEEDKLRPMFKNLPNIKDRYPYDVLRSGKFIETKDGKIIGQIDTIKNQILTLDVIDNENKHQTIEYDLVKLLKKLKNKEIKLTDNNSSKTIKIDTPFGTKFTIKNND